MQRTRCPWEVVQRKKIILVTLPSLKRHGGDTLGARGFLARFPIAAYVLYCDPAQFPVAAYVLYCDPREKPLDQSAIALMTPSQWLACVNRFSPELGLGC